MNYTYLHVLVILSIIVLYFVKIHYYYFGLGFVLNNMLNIVLKMIIKEPKDLPNVKAIKIAITNGFNINLEKFGMPSENMQNCGYCLLYIMMVLKNPLVSLLYLLITLYILNNDLMNNYTLFQELVGFVIGCSVGYLMYYLGNDYIIGNKKHKPDDNAVN